MLWQFMIYWVWQLLSDNIDLEYILRFMLSSSLHIMFIISADDCYKATTFIQQHYAFSRFVVVLYYNGMSYLDNVYDTA